MIPLISFLDFPNASMFEQSILSEAPIPVDKEAIMERYAKAVLQLFVPFRHEDQFTEGGKSHLGRFRELYAQGQISDETCTILQNIQDC